MNVRRIPRGRAGWRRLGERRSAPPGGHGGTRPRRGPAHPGRRGERDAGRAFGEAFRLELREQVPFDRSGESYDIVQRAAARVQARRSLGRRFRVEVPWIPAVPAFTVAGRYIYVSRHFVDRFPEEAGIAFAIAHEIAHHELGHVDAWTRWVRRARWLLPGEAGLTAGVVAAALEAYLVRPEQELAADRYALRLCCRAGYEEHACLRALDQLSTLALERRDLELVYGPEEGDGRPPGRVARWLWERTRRYPSLHARREALR